MKSAQREKVVVTLIEPRVELVQRLRLHGVLAAVARRQPVREARRAAGRSTFGGRVDGVPDGTRNLLIRAGFRASRQRYGAP
jgi:hypothetical protein